MIYTIGHTKSYETALKQCPNSLFKVKRGFHDGKFYEGGIIFKSYEDAIQYLKENELFNYSVYGVLGDLEKDTIPKGDGTYHLITQSLIKKPYLCLPV